jgi:hypothetical protein
VEFAASSEVVPVLAEIHEDWEMVAASVEGVRIEELEAHPSGEALAEVENDTGDSALVAQYFQTEDIQYVDYAEVADLEIHRNSAAESPQHLEAEEVVGVEVVLL